MPSSPVKSLVFGAVQPPTRDKKNPQEKEGLGVLTNRTKGHGGGLLRTVTYEDVTC